MASTRFERECSLWRYGTLQERLKSRGAPRPYVIGHTCRFSSCWVSYFFGVPGTVFLSSPHSTRKPWRDNQSVPAQCIGCRQIFAKRSSLTQLPRIYGRALRRWHATSGYAGSRPPRRKRPGAAAYKSVLKKCEKACAGHVVGPDALIAEMARSAND
jgi:hypothetical protein